MGTLYMNGIWLGADLVMDIKNAFIQKLLDYALKVYLLF